MEYEKTKITQDAHKMSVIGREHGHYMEEEEEEEEEEEDEEEENIAKVSLSKCEEMRCTTCVY